MEDTSGLKKFLKKTNNEEVFIQPSGLGINGI